MASETPQTGSQELVTIAEEQKSSLLVPIDPRTADQLASARAVHRMHDPNDLVALAQVVQQADDYTRATVGSKLELITQQIQFLQQQARQVLEEAKKDVSLAHARCNFKRIPNRIYHLYRRTNPDLDGEKYFSMLSPQEWGDRLQDEHLGSYRLEPDHSWTPIERIVERDARRRFDPQLLGVDRDQAANLAIAFK